MHNRERYFWEVFVPDFCARHPEAFKSSSDIPQLTKVVFRGGSGVTERTYGHLAALFRFKGFESWSTKRMKRSIEGFGPRGSLVGLQATLQGNAMWSFLDHWVTFKGRGAHYGNWDRRGNFTVGVPNYFVMDDLKADALDYPFTPGGDILFITSAPKTTRILEEFMGEGILPFRG